MSVHVFAGETFAALWDGDDVVIDERRAVCSCGCYADRLCCCARDCDKHPGGNDAERQARRADGELVGQLRLPDELLPIPAGEMFP